MAAEGNASTTQTSTAQTSAAESTAQSTATNGAAGASATPVAPPAPQAAPSAAQPQTAAASVNGYSALEELVQAATGRKERPKPWVDVTTYPWAEDEFSARFVRRANYQELYGMKETGEEVD